MALSELHKLYKESTRIYVDTVLLRTEKVIEKKILTNPVYQFDKGEIFKSIEIILQSKQIHCDYSVRDLTDAQ